MFDIKNINNFINLFGFSGPVCLRIFSLFYFPAISHKVILYLTRISLRNNAGTVSKKSRKIIEFSPNIGLVLHSGFYYTEEYCTSIIFLFLSYY